MEEVRWKAAAKRWRGTVPSLGPVHRQRGFMGRFTSRLAAAEAIKSGSDSCHIHVTEPACVTHAVTHLTVLLYNTVCLFSVLDLSLHEDALSSVFNHVFVLDGGDSTVRSG